MIIQTFLPALYESLGMFIPLIVVNCIILARAEAFASKNGPVASIVDGIGMGIGFTLAITLMGCIRELLGNGSLFGINVLGAGFEPMLLMILAPGGFLTYGLMLGAMNFIMNKAAARKAAKAAGIAEKGGIEA